MAKTIFIPLFFAGITTWAAAATTDYYEIKTDLIYRNDEKKEVSLHSKIKIAANNRSWVSFSEPQDGLLLLGRVARADRQSVQMEYLLIDSGKKPGAVVSHPRLNGLFGETAEISQGQEDQPPDFVLSFLAEKK